MSPISLRSPAFGIAGVRSPPATACITPAMRRTGRETVAIAIQEIARCYGSHDAEDGDDGRTGAVAQRLRGRARPAAQGIVELDVRLDGGAGSVQAGSKLSRR